MEYGHIDWIAVVIAAVLNMVIGFFWYSKWLFGSAWIKLSKLNEKELHVDAKTLAMTFVASFMIAYFLSLFEGALGVTTVTDGMFVGFLFWLAFVATTQISCYIWGKKPFQLFLIDTGYRLLSFLVMSGLIGA